MDWSRVLSHLDQGITQDHAPIAEPSGLVARFRQLTQYPWFWAHYRTLGPADISGRYQEWINAEPQDRERFTIVTPDARIAGANDSTDAGTMFRHDPAQGVLNPDRGLQYWSFYRVAIRPNTPSLAMYQHGPQPLMSVVEMKLLRAEALVRLGRNAEAAPLINETRVAKGMLPPVTAEGVPQAADCVPRKDNGACGDLFDAMMYEKNLETFGIVGGRPWWDRRGWGELAPGTMTQLPVPGRELESLRMTVYSFGGSPGTPGSAQ